MSAVPIGGYIPRPWRFGTVNISRQPGYITPRLAKRPRYGLARYVQKRRNRKSYTSIPRPIFSSIPQRAHFKLQYVSTLHHTTNPRDTAAMHGNGMFIYQPLYHDQILQIWQKYRVVSSQIELQITNSAAEGVCVVCYPNIDLTAPNSRAHASEQNYAKRIVVGSDNAADTNGLVHFMRTKTLYPELALTDDSFVGDAGSNPSSMWYWIVFSESIPADEAQDVYIEVKVIYNVICYRTFRQVSS